MSENVKNACICELGYDKGALKKTIENNIFTIYGNIEKNNYIILRYHGDLIDNIDYTNYTNNLYISYYFDNNPEEETVVSLAKCNKCIGENYCSLIHLESHDSIHFNFFLNDNSVKKYSCETTTFNLNIEQNIFEDFLNKYEIKENKNLPVTQNTNELQIKRLISNIKKFFITLFRKTDTI